MPSDPALYALVLENNRMLKALTERMTTQHTPDAKRPVVESAPRPEDDRVSFIRPEFVECPSCRAKPGSPPLCADCLERRELFERRSRWTRETEHKVRDAALEESAKAAWSSRHCEVIDEAFPRYMKACSDIAARIRALKSKPAPRGHLDGCALDANHKGQCFGPSLLEMEVVE
jgi:hypothetical protein